MRNTNLFNADSTGTLLIGGLLGTTPSVRMELTQIIMEIPVSIISRVARVHL